MSSQAYIETTYEIVYSTYEIVFSLFVRFTVLIQYEKTRGQENTKGAKVLND